MLVVVHVSVTGHLKLPRAIELRVTKCNDELIKAFANALAFFRGQC